MSGIVFFPVTNTYWSQYLQPSERNELAVLNAYAVVLFPEEVYYDILPYFVSDLIPVTRAVDGRSSLFFYAVVRIGALDILWDCPRSPVIRNTRTDLVYFYAPDQLVLQRSDFEQGEFVELVKANHVVSLDETLSFVFITLQNIQRFTFPVSRHLPKPKLLFFNSVRLPAVPY